MMFAILDVDDVLLRTVDASRSAAARIKLPLARQLPAHDAERVRDAFERHLETLRQRLQGSGDASPEYRELFERLEGLQAPVVSRGYDVKEWSRHSLLYCALSDCGITPTRSLIDEAADHYWSDVERDAEPYSDAASFVAELRERGFLIHLATNSDGFLQFDTSSGQFEYDPVLGRARKLERLTALWAMGFSPSNVTVGDPLGKAHPKFFQRVLADFAESAGSVVDLAATFALGDSLGSDVVPFVDMGARFGFWLRRDTNPSPTALPKGVFQLSRLAWSDVSSLTGR